MGFVFKPECIKGRWKSYPFIFYGYFPSQSFYTTEPHDHGLFQGISAKKGFEEQTAGILAHAECGSVYI